MMRLGEAACATGARLHGADVEFSAVSTDSRHIARGDLFIALAGDRFDGHDFVGDCLQHGAAAAMVSRSAVSGSPLLVVPDTRLALGRLAAHWRSRFSIPLAGITGSSGKTTVKDMLASILGHAAGRMEAVLATKGNLNNDIGVPLTLLALRAEHRFAVIEMGMNHAGEIAYLTDMARPTVALVNNALPAHLEGLGSVENVAHAKGEIFQGLPPDGVAVICADDAFAPLWRSLAAGRQLVSFGLKGAADVRATFRLETDASRMKLKTPHGGANLRLPVPGVHNVHNALAATAVALAMGTPLSAVVAGLEQFSGAKGRLQARTGVRGCKVLDDTYNANPASMHAALDVLAALPGQRIAVLGDMGELGPDARSLHADIGQYLKTQGVNAVFTLGELSRAYGGSHFDTPEALAAALLPLLDAQTTVLVKGSRFMRMERVAELLATTANEENRHAA